LQGSELVGNRGGGWRHHQQRVVGQVRILRRMRSRSHRPPSHTEISLATFNCKSAAASCRQHPPRPYSASTCTIFSLHTAPIACCSTCPVSSVAAAALQQSQLHAQRCNLKWAKCSRCSEYFTTALSCAQCAPATAFMWAHQVPLLRAEVRSFYCNSNSAQALAPIVHEGRANPNQHGTRGRRYHQRGLQEQQRSLLQQHQTRQV